MGFLKDFKAFAMKGNVIDMAVGVVIGGAFGKIVTSIVNDIIMPVFGYLTAGIKFTDLKLVLAEAVMDAEGAVLTPEVAITYGNLIQQVVDFLLIALSIFVVIRLVTKAGEKLRKQEEEAPAAEEPAGPTTEELLTEIRDLLKK